MSIVYYHTMSIHNIVVSKMYTLIYAPKYAKYGIWGAYAGAPNMVKWGVPGKILQNAVQARWS